MAVRVGATIEPMNNQNFPVAKATHISMVKSDSSTSNLQTMYDNGELGGLPNPTAANKILKSISTDDTIAWTEVDANNTQLTNGAGYQTASNVSESITTALSSYTPSSDLADVATSGDYEDLSNVPTSLSQFDNTTTNFQSESQVQALIAAAGSIHIEIVQQLPTTGQSNILYMVPKSSQKSDVYDEYIWVDSITPKMIGNYNLAEAMPELLSTTGQHVKATGITVSEGSITIFDSGASTPWFTYAANFGGYVISIPLTKSGGGTNIALQLRYKTTNNNFDSYNGIPTPSSGVDPSTVTSVTFQNATGDKTATVQLHLISKWEKIGSTEVDLSNYYTKAQTDSAIANSAENINYENSKTMSTNVKDAMDDLFTGLNSIDASILPQIKSFTMSVDADHEIGETVNSVKLDWEYNKTLLSSQSMNNSALAMNVRTLTYSTPMTSTTSFTLKCTDNHEQSVSQTKTVGFYHKVYWGSEAIPENDDYDSDFLLGLSNNAYHSGYAGSYTVTIATGEYGFFACPDSWNVPTQCLIGGYITDMIDCGTIEFVNAHGNETTFRILRTEHSDLGKITMIF